MKGQKISGMFRNSQTIDRACGDSLFLGGGELTILLPEKETPAPISCTQALERVFERNIPRVSV